MAMSSDDGTAGRGKNRAPLQSELHPTLLRQPVEVHVQMQTLTAGCISVHVPLHAEPSAPRPASSDPTVTSVS